MTAELLGAVAVGGAFVSSIILVIVAGLPARARVETAATPARRPAPSASFTPAHGRGFTSVELMVAVGIAAILAAIAAPSLMAMVASQRVKTATFDLYSAMSYARSEAIKRSAVVTITPHTGGFAKGYDLSVGGAVIKSQMGDPNVSISAPTGTPLAFDAFGRLTTPALYQLELSSGQPGVTPKRCLVISTTGRPSIRVDGNHDGNCING
jgi:type IV fimbrial biogenesis protein FimT